MNKKIIVTIARQYGSGGRYIGEKLAEALGCAFYDKELIDLAAKESGVDKALFESNEEKTSSVWKSLIGRINMMGGSPLSGHDMTLTDQLFLIQADVIRKIAERESCVIVGRAGNYILQDMPEATHIFVHAKEEDRINRIVTHYGVEESKAKDLMIKIDKKRASFHEYYTGEKWGMANSYHLSIDSGCMEIEETADILARFAKARIERTLK